MKTYKTKNHFLTLENFDLNLVIGFNGNRVKTIEKDEEKNYINRLKGIYTL